MTNRWTPIELRLHEESGLHYPENHVRKILEACINGILNDVESEIDDAIYESFLLTCSGIYLDMNGEEIGILRETDETDDEYRQRLFNALSSYLSVNFVKLQGMILYSKDELESNIRSKLTSLNPYLSKYYAGIPKNSIATEFLTTDMIYEYNIYYYVKGW
ncbi:hypothetical protein [Methanosphaera sp.]